VREDSEQFKEDKVPEDLPLETSGFSPLRRFRGRCKDVRKDTREGQRGTFDVGVFEFIDLEVIESVTPYPFPIATIEIRLSGRTETAWDAFAQSLKRALGEAATTSMLGGKMQEWAMLPSPLRRPRPKMVKQADGNEVEQEVWSAEDEPAWQVVSVEGAAQAAEDLGAHILDVADGKTEKALYEALLGDAKIRSNPSIVTQITDRKLVSGLIESGALSRDTEGILHKA